MPLITLRYQTPRIPKKQFLSYAFVKGERDKGKKDKRNFI